MALFKNMYITSKGMELYAKAQAGQEIHFTKMQVGSGQIETQNPVTLLALLDPKLDVPITSIVPNPEFKSATIIGSITNRDVKEALYICELGLFAKDPDEGEILYGYVSAGQYGDYYAQGPYSWQYEVNAAIGNAANVTAELSELQWDYGVINSNRYFLHLIGGNQREINKSIDETFDKVIKDAEDFKTNIKKGIGTKNLILNSNFKDKLNLWTTWNSNLNVDENLNCIVKAIINERPGFGIFTPTISLVKGQKYTVSFLLSSYYNVGILDYLYIISDTSGSIKLPDLKIDKSTSLYNFYNFTFECPYNATDAKILIGAVKKGATDEGFRLRNVKVEKGIIPTDWTPAPEEITNKLDTIQTGAEVNQNAISKIKIREQILIPTLKTDTIELKLDNNIETFIYNKEITIKKKIKTNSELELTVDSVTGKNDSNENTPFKTIQAALDYIKNYYSGLSVGCNITITPGEYKDYFIISNFGVEYGVITLKSSELDLIPDKGNITEEAHSVNVIQFDVKNNSTTIQFAGFTTRGLNPSIIKVDTSLDGFPYVKLIDFVNNTNIVFNKSYIYGSAGNLQQWKYYYGFRPFYSKIVIRDSRLGQFSIGMSGGTSAPIRTVDNSDVVLLNVKFDNNALYDIIGEESRIHLRNCSRVDGSPIKKNLSGSCIIAEG